MSALDDIEAATAALNALTAQEAAEKARIDTAMAAALAAIASPTKTIYLDAVAGLDTNDGSTPALAVATPGKALSLVGAGQDVGILLCSDVTLAAPLSLRGSRVTFWSNGTTFGGVNGSGFVTRKLTLAPSSGVSPYAAQGVKGVPLSSDNCTILNFINLNLSIGALQSAQCDSAIKPQGAMGFLNVALTLDPGLQVPVISPWGPSTVFANGLTLPAGYGGKLFAGVPAGANPNGFLVSTNITAG